METKFVIPILNRSMRTFGGPAWYLNDDLWIQTISPEEYGVFQGSSYLNYQSLITSKTKCIHLKNFVDPDNNSSVINEISKISFLLNYFSNEKPVALSFVIHYSKKIKTRVVKIFDLPLIVDSRYMMKYTYSLSKLTLRSTISDFYKVLSKCCKENNNLYLTLSRFNAAVSKSEKVDQIVDLTIALESLIEGTNELRNRFALYNSWVAESDQNNRLETYKLLIQLYDARSKIVHGSSDNLEDKDIKPVVEKWEQLIIISKKIVGYYLFFLYEKTVADWHKHQKGLTLGLENRIL